MVHENVISPDATAYFVNHKICYINSIAKGDDQ